MEEGHHLSRHDELLVIASWPADWPPQVPDDQLVSLAWEEPGRPNFAIQGQSELNKQLKVAVATASEETGAGHRQRPEAPVVVKGVAGSGTGGPLGRCPGAFGGMAFGAAGTVAPDPIVVAMVVAATAPNSGVLKGVVGAGKTALTGAGGGGPAGREPSAADPRRERLRLLVSTAGGGGPAGLALGSGWDPVASASLGDEVKPDMELRSSSSAVPRSRTPALAFALAFLEAALVALFGSTSLGICACSSKAVHVPDRLEPMSVHAM